MKTMIVALIAASGLYGAVAHGECTYPKAPESLPNGETATKEEMLAAKQVVGKYNDEMTAYLNCIKLESDEDLAAMEKEAEQSDEGKKALAAKKQEYALKHTQKHNAAVDEVTSVVERFNEQVRLYKKKQSG
jgi:hypothetical protein